MADIKISDTKMEETIEQAPKVIHCTTTQQRYDWCGSISLFS